MRAAAAPLERRAAFGALRAPCVELMRAVCEKAALAEAARPPAEAARALDAGVARRSRELAAVAREQDPADLQQCAEYALLPLFKALPSLLGARREEADGPASQPRDQIPWGESAWIALLDCVKIVLARCGPRFLADRPDIVLQVLDAALAALDLEAAQAEEILLAAVHMMQTALGAGEEENMDLSNGATWQALAAPQGSNSVLHGLFVHATLRLLETAKVQRARGLRVACLNAAGLLLAGVGKVRPEAVEAVLPGVSGALGGIIMEDFKSGSAVRAAAVDAWAPAIRCVLSDRRALGKPMDRDQTAPGESADGPTTPKGPDQDGDLAWAAFARERRPRRRAELAETCARLDVMLRAILRHEHVSGPESRAAQQSLTRLSAGTIQDCAYTIVDNSPVGAARTLLSTLVEILITLEVSEDPETRALAREARERSQRALSRAAAADDDGLQEGAWAAHVEPALDECLRDALRKLPSDARAGGEAAFRHRLASCRALIQAVGQTRLQVLLDAWSPVQPILTAMELHKDHDERTLLPWARGAVEVAFPVRRFVHFHEKLTRDALAQTLGALFSSAPSSRRQLYGELMSHTQTGAGDRHEAWLLLSSLVRTPEHQDPDAEDEICRDCILACVRGLGGAGNGGDDGPPRRLLVSLQLEVLGQCFLGQQREIAKRLLVEALFPVLVHASSAFALEADSASAALGCIAAGCGYASRVELIQANVDYLLDATSLWLDDLEEFPQTPNILCTLLGILRQAALPPGLRPFIRDLVDGVLRALELRRSDVDPGALTEKLLLVLKSALQLFPLSESSELPKPSRDEDPLGILLEEFESASRGLSASADLDPTKYAEDEPAASEEGAPETKKEASFEETLAKSVLLHCRFFTRHESLGARRLALESTGLALGVLASNRDELLPMIHDAWAGVEGCLASEDSAAVLTACFGLVRACIDLAPDFMERRYLQNGPWTLMSAKLADASVAHARLERRGQHETDLLRGVLACAECASLRLYKGAGLVKTAPLLARLAADLLLDPSIQAQALQVLRAVATRFPDAMWLEVITHALRDRNMGADRLGTFSETDLPGESELGRGLSALRDEDVEELLQLMDEE